MRESKVNELKNHPVQPKQRKTLCYNLLPVQYTELTLTLKKFQILLVATFHGKGFFPLLFLKRNIATASSANNNHNFYTF